MTGEIRNLDFNKQKRLAESSPATSGNHKMHINVLGNLHGIVLVDVMTAKGKGMYVHRSSYQQFNDLTYPNS